MNIFATLYLKLSRAKFQKTFKPLGFKKRRNFLVSMPSDTADFIKSLTFLAGIKKLGNIVMLVPQRLESIYRFIKPNSFEIIFYKTTTEIFSKEYKRLKKQVENKNFHFLIELNKPANICLPYLVPAEKRICFYDENTFPYYNIMIKDTVCSLNEFFNIKESKPQKLLRFYARDSKKLLKKLKKKKPILFVNGEDNIDWQGDKIVVGEDVSLNDIDIYKLLYISDAYYGKIDALYEFAKLFNKLILK